MLCVRQSAGMGLSLPPQRAGTAGGALALVEVYLALTRRPAPLLALQPRERHPIATTARANAAGGVLALTDVHPTQAQPPAAPALAVQLRLRHPITTTARAARGYRRLALALADMHPAPARPPAASGAGRAAARASPTTTTARALRAGAAAGVLALAGLHLALAAQLREHERTGATSCAARSPPAARWRWSACTCGMRAPAVTPSVHFLVS